MTIVAAHAARVSAAAVLLVACGTAAASPVMPVWLSVCAATLLVVALVRPQWALLALVALAPWGARMADVPVRATEYLAFACVAGWLLRVDRRLVSIRSNDWLRVVPGVLYASLAVMSWMRLTAAASPRTGWLSVVDMLRLLPADYLVAAGRDPHTAAMLQIVLGVVLCLTIATLVTGRPAVSSHVGLILALGSLVAAAATVIAVPVRYWASGDWNEVIRYFVATRSRYAFHVADVNAAGSHFILGGVLAVGAAVRHPRHRGWWVAGLLVMLMALWISGSRAAIGAGVALSVCLLFGRRLVDAGVRWPSMSTRLAGGVAIAVVLVLALAPAVVGSASAMSGSASRSLSVREEFLITSGRMIATAPALGVGVGTYYQRSGGFMPAGIRALYGRENAHNYFMQTTAELGLLGLAAFLWWLGSVLAPAWRVIDRTGVSSFPLSLLCGCVAFLLTCVTGHPLLVVEVSLPFWAALGVAMSGCGMSESAANAKVY